MRLRASRRLLTVAAASVIPFLAATFTASWVPLAALVPIVGLVVVALVEALLPLPRRAGRRIDDVKFRGDRGRLDAVVPKAFLPHNLVPTDALPEGLTAEERMAGRREPEGWAIPTQVIAVRRGVLHFPDLELSRLGALGLFERTTNYPARLTATVLATVPPRLRLKSKPRMSGGGQWTASNLRHSAGSEFYSLRPYVPGDSLRDINWKATARTHRITTNQFLPDEPARMVVYLDARRNAAETGREDAFERGLVLGATLIETLLASGIQAGLVLLSWDARSCVPGIGRKHASRLRRLLLECSPGEDAPLEDLVAVTTPHLPARADAVLITSNRYDPTLPAAAAMLRRRHRRLVVISPAFPAPRGHDTAAIASRASASLLNAEMEAGLAMLRRVADDAFTWAPDEPAALLMTRLAPRRRR